MVFTLISSVMLRNILDHHWGFLSLYMFKRSCHSYSVGAKIKYVLSLSVPESLQRLFKEAESHQEVRVTLKIA